MQLILSQVFLSKQVRTFTEVRGEILNGKQVCSEWLLKNSFDAGVLPTSAFVESSCEPPLRLTNLLDGVTLVVKPTRSVRRPSGFVLVGISDK
jgi:hypothetical protein